MNIYDRFYNYKHFYEPSKFAIANLIISDGMGYESNKVFLIDRNYFDNYLIMHVLTGVLYVKQFDKTHKVTPGQGILMDLRNKHKYYFEKDCNSSIVWFHFRGNPCQTLLDELNHSNGMPLIFSSDTILKDIYEMFKITKDQNKEKEFLLSSKIYNILISILKNIFLEMQYENKYSYSFKIEVDNYIAAHLNSKVNLTEFAIHFNMSKYHFCRTFKSHFNTTLFSYIKIKKIEIAKKLLLHTNDSVSEISNYLDFYDQGYFSNIFKSTVGCSPREYRLMNK